jgi:LuxR family transcriptional regulator, regulator of acetate metabolism
VTLLGEARASLDEQRELAERLADALAHVAESGTWTDFAGVQELHRRARQLLDDGVVARLAALARVRETAARMAELGPVSELVDQAPAHAAEAAGLSRVLLSRVEQGALVAEALHVDGDPDGAAATLARVRQQRVALDYPMVEAEILRRRRPLLVRDAGGAARGRHPFGEALAWRDYVTAPVLLEGRVAGLLHGDRGRSGLPVTALERDALWTFAQEFAALFERAVLRRRLRTQREEMRQVASWADARTSELNDRSISLAPEREPAAAGDARESGAQLRELLTRREIDVLELMVKGETNAGIARALVVAEGTVKFHVKNILRKLQASNRAEATSRYLRLTLR